MSAFGFVDPESCRATKAQAKAKANQAAETSLGQHEPLDFYLACKQLEPLKRA